MLKKESDQDVAHKGRRGVSRALGSFQAFRDNRTNCSDLPAIDLPGWLLLPCDPAAGTSALHLSCQPYAQACVSAHRARGAGSRCPPFPMQPSTSDWRQHVNTSLTDEVYLHSAQLGHQILVQLKTAVRGRAIFCMWYAFSFVVFHSVHSITAQANEF